MSHGNRPPRYCEPNAPASKAAGRRKAISRAVAGLANGADDARGASATASLIPGLASLLGDRRRRRDGPGNPLQRIDRIIKLEVLDTLLLELGGSGREARIGGVVALEQLVVDLRLVEQVVPQVGLAGDRPVLVIGIRQLRHGDIRVDPAFLNRVARRRVVTRGGESERRPVPKHRDRLNRALAEGAFADDQSAAAIL